MNSPLATAAFLGAASLVSVAFAQNVPTPPPAGVVPVRPRAIPMNPQPAAGLPQADVQPAQTEPLPQLPENPIKLEDAPRTEVVPQAPEATPAPQSVVAVPPASLKPVKPVGPMYYFAPGPNTYPANVMTPPAMHIPNSPFVEDLSVAGDHGRYTYYSYRRPWYTPGHQSANVTIVW